MTYASGYGAFPGKKLTGVGTPTRLLNINHNVLLADAIFILALLGSRRCFFRLEIPTYSRDPGICHKDEIGPN